MENRIRIIEIRNQPSEAEIRRNSKIWADVRTIERWIARKPELADAAMVNHLNDLRSKIGLPVYQVSK